MGNIFCSKKCIKCGCPLSYYYDNFQDKNQLLLSSCRDHRIMDGVCLDCGSTDRYGNCVHTWSYVICSN